MQKVRSCSLNLTRAAYKTTISRNFPHGTLYTIAYVLYLVFEEGSPYYSNNFLIILLNI